MNEEIMKCGLVSGDVESNFHHPDDIADNGYPRHAMAIQLYVCCDSRRDRCPYALGIDVRNQYVSFAQTLCLFGIREKQKT